MKTPGPRFDKFFQYMIVCGSAVLSYICCCAVSAFSLDKYVPKGHSASDLALVLLDLMYEMTWQLRS